MEILMPKNDYFFCNAHEIYIFGCSYRYSTLNRVCVELC